MSSAFDIRSIASEFRYVEACPPYLLNPVVALPLGDLPVRVRGATAWHEALLAGRLPPPTTWPGAPFDGAVRGVLEQLGIVRFCKDQLDLVEPLMLDIVEAFRRSGERFDSDVATRLGELEELERARLAEQALKARARRKVRTDRVVVGDSGDGNGASDAAEVGAASVVALPSDVRERLRAEAEAFVRAATPAPDDTLLQTWGERARIWSELAEVFDDLGHLLGRGWDLTAGVLRHAGWLDMLRLRELLERVPQLRELIRTIGQLQLSDDGASTAQTIFQPVQRLEEELREIPTPLVPAETRGVERSGEIARMLPAEAAMLGHPKLRLLWHARRAERALLTYRVEGIEIERTWREVDDVEAVEQHRPRPERGPILAVVDTSGSMHGVPEQVAKALVLEAARTAHAERRRCYVIAYSGPGEIIEHELDLSPDGLGRLLAFLAHTFGGGTDVAGMMPRVIERLREQAWAKADVVFVTDGEWPAPASLVASVDAAKERGTRFHGVLIGSCRSAGLRAICDPVHVFSDWGAMSTPTPASRSQTPG